MRDKQFLKKTMSRPFDNDEIKDCILLIKIQSDVFTKAEEAIHENSLYEYKQQVKVLGGMQSEPGSGRYETEMKALIKLYGDIMKEEELKKYLEQSNGNISIVIEQITTTLLDQKTDIIEEIKNEQLKENKNGDTLKKEEEKVEIGETKSGINLQGYCTNMDCLVAKAKLPVWVNIGFDDISFKPDKTLYCCPDCGQLTVTSIVKAMLFNSEHSINSSDNSIPVKDNHYQCFYPIKSGLSYEVKSKKIRQHATSLEDLITRSENAMVSNEIINLVAKYLITVVKPQKVKDSIRLQEKIKCDYSGDYNQ
ncbi:hypothetical protein RFI_02807, partial [Reticulomyxa filosa]